MTTKNNNTKEHCTIRNGKLFCLHCGQSMELPIPMSINMSAAMMNAFQEDHKDCVPKWKAPEVDLTLSIKDRQIFWLMNGERGVSSETIFRHLSDMPINIGYECHPLDPSDFKRCFLLLEAIPEWKSELHRMKKVSPVWSSLVDNWDKLTEMVKEQLQTGKDNGMYLFMKELGC